MPRQNRLLRTAPIRDNSWIVAPILDSVELLLDVERDGPITSLIFLIQVLALELALNFGHLRRHSHLDMFLPI